PGRAADEQAIDARHADEFGAIAGIDGAAVEAGRAAAEDRRRRGDDLALPGVGVTGAGRRAVVADRPHRLIGEQDSRASLRSRQLRQRAAHLARQNFARLAAVLLGQRLADADQRDQAVAHRRLDLEADGLVSLAEMLAPLGMAEFDEIHAAIAQHRRRDFPGPGAGVGPVHGLRADLDAGFAQYRLHLADRRERWDDEALDARIALGVGGAQRFGEDARLGQRLVHLPRGA